MTDDDILNIQTKIKAIDPISPSGAAQSLRFIALLLSESLLRRSSPGRVWPHTSTKE